MSVETPIDRRADLQPPLLVSRQPVVDQWDRVTGYRISYALLAEAGPVPPSASQAIEIVDEVMSVIGEEEHVSGSRAHLPVTREMLRLPGGVPTLRPDQVLLRIRYEDAVDKPTSEVLERTARRGYAMELDGLPGPDFDIGLLDRFGTIEIDVASWDLDDLSAVLPQIRRHRAVALAAGVRNHAQRELARSLGFEWFSGPFFATPNLLAGSPIPMGNLRTLVELARLQSTGAPTEQLIQLIECDVGLGVRLLRYINSAYFSLAGRVRSIRHAAAMIGARGLSRWALIAATVGGSEEIPRELALLSLTRARACELLSLERDEPVGSDEMFTIGLLSAVDTVFRLPIEKIVDELPLADSTARALVHHTGAGGEMLASVIDYEQGEFLAPSLRASLQVNSDAYRAALTWARDALAGMA